MTGFILLHREVLDWEWYSDTNTKILFIHLLLKANWEEKKWRGITISRGQLFTSVGSLSKDLCLSAMQVRTSLTKLKVTNEITIETTSEGTKVTICKYETYQDIEKQNNKRKKSKITNEQQTNNKPVTTTKQLEELKEENKEQGDVYALFKIELLANGRHRDDRSSIISRNLGGIDREKAIVIHDGYVEDFILHLSGSKQWEGTKRETSHFVNWFNIKMQKEKERVIAEAVTQKTNAHIPKLDPKTGQPIKK